MSIHNALSKITTQNKHKGEIGLEIETETLLAYEVPKFALWNVQDDGSLRDFGREYIFKRPMMFEKEVPLALDEFTKKTKDIPFKKDSFTTSVHVHLNVQNDTFQTLGNFLTVYSLVENLLTRFSGPDRLSNTFCLPMCDSEGTFNNIITMCRNIDRKHYHGMNFDEDSTKYGALNLSSLVRFGSLEVRLFRGETDMVKVLEWISILYEIMTYARQKDMHPSLFINRWQKEGLKMLDEIFGEFRKIIGHKDEENLLDENFWFAITIAQSVKDWTKMEVEPKARKLSVKDLDKWSTQLFKKSFNDLSETEKKSLMQYVKDMDYEFPDPNNATVAEGRPGDFDTLGTQARTGRGNIPRQPVRGTTFGNLGAAVQQPEAPIEWDRLRDEEDM